MKRMLLSSILLLAAATFAQSTVPSGTILPAKLNSSLNSKKSKAGQMITATVAQDVPLPMGGMIRAGSKLTGHITAAMPAASGAGARLSLQFDSLLTARRRIAITTDLRAIASDRAVEDAQLPETGPDRGTPMNAWTTDQIGGDINNQGGGSVMRGTKVVGESVPGGVLARISSEPGSACRGEIGDNVQLQALWVFSSDACGTYGFLDLTIAHRGRTQPFGQIVISSEKGDINVRSGSGLLLRVINSTDDLHDSK